MLSNTLPEAAILPPLIERFSEEFLRDGIDHHIAGSGIEGDNLSFSSIRWDRREVRDAADVLHNASDMSIAKKHVIEEGNQRRAFASGGHICRTKVRDHGSTGSCGDQCRFARLPRGRDLAAQKWTGLALMVNRLSMAADEVGFCSKAALGGQHGVGI